MKLLVDVTGVVAELEVPAHIEGRDLLKLALDAFVPVDAALSKGAGAMLLLREGVSVELDRTLAAQEIEDGASIQLVLTWD